MEALKIKYKNIPSMNEYALKKYNAVTMGTRNFKSILAYNCENDLEYYNIYLSFIKEYEAKHLLEDKITYIINKNQKQDLPEIINNMKKRFPMYFGNYNLENFRAFFDGYIKCKHDYGIKINDYENNINEFTGKIKCKTIDMEGKNITWDRKYRYNIDGDSWGQLSDKVGKEIVNKFFEELENKLFALSG